ncbi:MAG: hypothetical protein LBF87_05290 [Treponema sp.]|nr:hypothetical protein [Treponema sp.]
MADVIRFEEQGDWYGRGVIPLEQMDLIVDPVEQKLAGKHSDEWVRYVQQKGRILWLKN